MTVDLTIAHCPRCGHVDSVFIRSEDDLLCRGCCLGLATPLLGAHPRQSVPPDTAWSAGIDDGPAPPILAPRGGLGRRHYRRIP